MSIFLRATPMLILIVFPFLIVACLGTIVTFDLLVRLEHKDHRENWDLDGKPYGVVWVPPGTKRGIAYAFGNPRVTFIQYKWLFSTPDWMRADQKALRLILWNRIFGFIWLVGMLLILTTLLLTKIV